MRRLLLERCSIRHLYMMRRSCSELTAHPPIVYTDGACKRNGQEDARAGIGTYWGRDDSRNYSGPLVGSRQTNNRAEIHAAMKAVQQARTYGLDSLIVRTDSKFLARSVQEWMPNWKVNGWKKTNGKCVINKDDFVELDRAIDGLDVKFEHVSRKINKDANRLAQNAVKDCRSIPNS